MEDHKGKMVHSVVPPIWVKDNHSNESSSTRGAPSPPSLIAREGNSVHPQPSLVDPLEDIMA